MKTPIQEIYAHLKASKEKDSFGETYCVDWLLENESKMLEEEKEFIEDVYEDGLEQEYQFHINGKKQISSLEYYDKKFNQKNANK